MRGKLVVAFLLLLAAHAQAASWPEDAPPFAVHPAELEPLQSAVAAATVAADCTALEGEVVLTGDLDCADLASNTTLDLNGFAVGSVSTGSVHQVATGVTLRNGTARAIDFSRCRDCLIEEIVGEGIGNYAVLLGSDNVVRNSRFTGAIDVWGVHNVVRDSRFVGTSYDGYALDLYFGEASTIEGSYFEGYSLAVWMNDTNENVVHNNVFVDNRVGVSMYNEELAYTGFNQITDNLFAGNDWGVALTMTECTAAGGPVSECLKDNVIAHNFFVGNERHGIYIVDWPPCDLIQCFPASASGIVMGNVFLRNGYGNPDGPGDGLHVEVEPEVADGFFVAGNSASFNADVGIDAEGVIDGGWNSGRHNRSGVDCIGVDCSGVPACGQGMQTAWIALPLGWLGRRYRRRPARG